MKAQLEFTAPYGDERKKILVSQPAGGHESYDVYIDNYYQGNIFKREGSWTGNPNKLSSLTLDDIQLLGEKIEKSISARA